MADKFSKEKRSEVMSKIKSSGTKIELQVEAALRERGITKFRMNARDYHGAPDFLFERSKIVVFVDSCFWHGCPKHYRRPQSNQEFWDKKYERNTLRDVQINGLYTRTGWHLYRIWEHELKKDKFDETIDELVNFIRKWKAYEKKKRDSRKASRSPNKRRNNDTKPKSDRTDK